MPENNLPIISIVMPLYNKEAEVMRSVNSVLKQAVPDWELIIVNDGSTDKGPDIVRAVKDKRIRIIEQSNQGVSAARNKGIAEARAGLIAFLDADDEWAPDFLETILRLKDKFPDCAVCATSYYITHGNDRKRNAILRGIKSSETDFRMTNYFEVAIQSDPPISSSSVAVSRKAILSVDGFPVGIRDGEDLLTWARLAIKYNIAYSTGSHAIFYSPVFVSDRPSRLPQCPDVVGEKLSRLRDTVTGQLINDLDHYISLWHRMRAIVYLQVGKMRDARNEIKVAIRHSGKSARLLFLLLLTYMPYSLSILIFKTIKKIREDNR